MKTLQILEWVIVGTILILWEIHLYYKMRKDNK